MSSTLEAPVHAPASTDDERLVHIVRRSEWPTALCGASVKDLLQLSAPGMDRCADCQRIAREMGARLTGFR